MLYHNIIIYYIKSYYVILYWYRVILYYMKLYDIYIYIKPQFHKVKFCNVHTVPNVLII